jgi:hypothetical protein
VADIQDHLDNLRDGTGVTEISSPFSIKSGTAKANLQLTVAKGRKNGKDVFLLDADFDENSKPLLHVFDVIKHKFDGGTPRFTSMSASAACSATGRSPTRSNQARRSQKRTHG